MIFKTVSLLGPCLPALPAFPACVLPGSKEDQAPAQRVWWIYLISAGARAQTLWKKKETGTQMTLFVSV